MNIAHAWCWFAPPATPTPHTAFGSVWASQGVLTESAGAEYQHTLEYIYVLIKKLPKYSFFSLSNLHLVFLL